MKFDVLHIAEYGTVNEMKEAIKEGSDINIKDEDEGIVPLMGAIAYDNESIAKLLLENGADASIQDNDGNNALYYAIEYVMIDIAKIILKKFPKTLHVQNKYGDTILWKALMKAEIPLDFIKILLDKGADKESAIDLVKSYDIKEINDLFKKY